MQNNSQIFNIEVAYAGSNLLIDQEIIKLTLYSRINIQQAIELSGILNKFSEIQLTKNKVGVFGKIAGLLDLINDGDRIEIYRDLELNPNISRMLKVSGRSTTS